MKELCPLSNIRPEFQRPTSNFIPTQGAVTLLLTYCKGVFAVGKKHPLNNTVDNENYVRMVARVTALSSFFLEAHYTGTHVV